MGPNNSSIWPKYLRDKSWQIHKHHTCYLSGSLELWKVAVSDCFRLSINVLQHIVSHKHAGVTHVIREDFRIGKKTQVHCIPVIRSTKWWPTFTPIVATFNLKDPHASKINKDSSATSFFYGLVVVKGTSGSGCSTTKCALWPTWFVKIDQFLVAAMGSWEWLHL